MTPFPASLNAALMFLNEARELPAFNFKAAVDGGAVGPVAGGVPPPPPPSPPPPEHEIRTTDRSVAATHELIERFIEASFPLSDLSGNHLFERQCEATKGEPFGGHGATGAA
jgi:hypothetical protein